jgi:hypothetical protein
MYTVFCDTNQAWRFLSSGMWRRVVWYIFTDVSEERVIFFLSSEQNIAGYKKITRFLQKSYLPDYTASQYIAPKRRQISTRLYDFTSRKTIIVRLVTRHESLKSHKK